MHLVLPLLATIPLATAWRVGLWGHGVSRQLNKTPWGCYNVDNPIVVGQLTFDGVTNNYPDPCWVVVYRETGCVGPIKGMCPSLTGVSIGTAQTVRSVKVGSNPTQNCCP